MRFLFVCLCVWLFSSFPVQAQNPPDDPAMPVQALSYNGIDRSYYLHIPEDIGESPPLVIVLHPTASSGKAMALLTGMDAVADENGFAVVYPNSDGLQWGENPEMDRDDVGFMAALIDHLAEADGIDPENVSVVGFGNGGLMTYRLACESPGRFQSFAVVGALMWDYHHEACTAAFTEDVDPVNLLVMHGTADQFYDVETWVDQPVFGGESSVVLGEDDTLEFWANWNGCDPESTEPSNAAVVYSGCRDSGGVALYRVLGGGQNWPRIGDYRLNQFGVDASQKIAQFFAGDVAWQEAHEPYEEQARSYIVYVPDSYDPAEPLPVVVSLHGRYGNGASMAQVSGFNGLAELKGFINVYPNGLGIGTQVKGDTGWNYSRDVPYFMSSNPQDDVAFLVDLIEDLSVDIQIDRSRVYVNGLSNGGFMVHRLACDAPDVFAAFGSVAGSGFLGLVEICQSDNPVPVPMMIIHGTADDNIPWNGRAEMMGTMQVYTTLPILRMVEFWAVRNGCTETADTQDIPQSGNSPQTSVRVMELTDCPANGTVTLVGVINGGHNWPGYVWDEAEADGVNRDIYAEEVLWEFFSRFSLPESSINSPDEGAQ